MTVLAEVFECPAGQQYLADPFIAREEGGGRAEFGDHVAARAPDSSPSLSIPCLLWFHCGCSSFGLSPMLNRE